jgi:hypothetical protein
VDSKRGKFPLFPYWSFMRRYTADDKYQRTGLVPHEDINSYTMNVMLNYDFLGGELFFVKV